MTTKIFIPVFVILAVLLGACGLNVDLNLDRGSGKVTTETRQVSNFDRLVLSGIGDVTILQGDKESLEIEAEDNVLPHILTKVEDGTLHISFDRKTIVPTKPIKFTLSMRDVRGLDTQGVSNISADAIKTDRLKLGISGTGNIHIRNLQAERVESSVSGAGSLEIEGRVDTQVVTMSGAGNYDSEDLESQTAEVTITGLGKVVIWATSDLSVVISGTGGVDYYGSPQVVQQISGLGRLKHLGNK